MVKTVHAQVTPSATTLQMMQKLHKKKGIPIHEMQLWHNNRHLEEDKPLRFYGITNGTSLTLKRFTRSGECPCVECKRMEEKITLTVTWLSKSIRVECTLGEPVETLKHAICKMEGIPVARQKLTYRSQTLEDHKLLASYKFGNSDEETGDTTVEPNVVHMFVDCGTPSVLDKLCTLFSLQRFQNGASSPSSRLSMH